jgi:hypothetical protein
MIGGGIRYRWRPTASTLAGLVAIGASASCGGDGARMPGAPTAVAPTLLAPGAYVLNIVAPFELSGCSGPGTVPVLRRDVGLLLERVGGSQLRASASGWQGDLTLRLTETDRSTTGLIATVDGSAEGVGHTALGLAGPALSVRLTGNQLRGTATSGGASGDIGGPIVFTSTGSADVTCASGRWSMGRFPE